MDNLNGENNLHQDLGTIKECEADSCNYDAIHENELALDLDQIEIRSHQQNKPQFENNKNVINSSPYAPQVAPQNLFGSRTYTSPASFDSSSIYSNPFRSDLNKSKAMNMPARKFTTKNSNSIVTRLRSDNQSEKFHMLRNVIENIHDPQKRKVLLDFLDQTTLKTEYVTMKESSSSGEEVKRLGQINDLSKRRHKSPINVMPNPNFPRRRNNNVCSEERKRFSLVQPRLKSVAPPEQLHIRNYAIERKNGSDEFDSKNGDKCFTEESKEVPLEAILERFHNYQNPFQSKRPRTPSGYSASHDEATNVDGQVQEPDGNFDIEIGIDLEEGKKHRKADIIVLPGDLLDNKPPSVERARIPMVKYIKKFRTALMVFLALAILALVARNIYLEVKVKTYPDRIFELDKKINELMKENSQLEVEYNN